MRLAERLAMKNVLPAQIYGTAALATISKTPNCLFALIPPFFFTLLVCTLNRPLYTKTLLFLSYWACPPSGAYEDLTGGVEGRTEMLDQNQSASKPARNETLSCT